ncbi:flagellar hook-length control protein FliK [Parasulfitobacter algicola]|uniref:Flagellar hook-length control protein FliK n=1 Tax=Parasulfitobacter algicola TaxID=2614809 RepID=A0ABX2IVN6_9RHOB|nr:flagellar hook-length control protein FliK [Sulfitobacter algicola]NSX56565.1 flagellar hook-length control protein FliK [Sulfitobacter algicola]
MYFEMRHSLIAPTNPPQTADVGLTASIEGDSTSFISFMTDDIAEAVTDDPSTKLAQQEDPIGPDDSETENADVETEIEALTAMFSAPDASNEIQKENSEIPWLDASDGKTSTDTNVMDMPDANVILTSGVATPQATPMPTEASEVVQPALAHGLQNAPLTPKAQPFVADNGKSDVTKAIIDSVPQDRRKSVDNLIALPQTKPPLTAQPMPAEPAIVAKGPETASVDAVDIQARDVPKTPVAIKTDPALVLAAPMAAAVSQVLAKKTDQNTKLIEIKTPDAPLQIPSPQTKDYAVAANPVENFLQKVPDISGIMADIPSFIATDFEGFDKGTAPSLTSSSETVVTTHRGFETRLNVPELPKFVAAQMADAARGASDNIIELQLNPEELGRVRMTLTTQDTGLTMVLQIERPETLELMRRNIEALSQEFKNMGYTDISFDFGQNENTSGDQQDTPTPPSYQGEFDDSSDAVRVTLSTVTDGLDLRL